METIARIRGTSIEASAEFSRVQSLRSPRYPISETIPAIAPGAAEKPRFLVIVSNQAKTPPRGVNFASGTSVQALPSSDRRQLRVT
jgi:hypothetical protein